MQVKPAESYENQQISKDSIDWNSHSFSYTTQELPAEIDEQVIYGQIYIPDEVSEPMPAVIFSHGYGGTHSTGASYAQVLAQKGFVVYCYDFRGGSNNSQSEGSPLEMSVFTEKSDLEAVLSMIQSLDYVNSELIFLMGTSQGGMVSAMTGAAHPDEIQGMMLLYPAFCIPDIVRSRYQNIEDIPESLSFFSWLTVGKNYAADVLNYDVYADVAAYNKNILILHGDQDEIVDLSYSQRAVEEFPAAELKIIEGAGHDFGGSDFDLAIDYILAYLSSQII